MREDKHIEREIATRVIRKYDDLWEEGERYHKILHKIKESNAEIQEIKYRMRGIRKEIQIIKQSQKKWFVQSWKIDAEYDEDYNEIYGIEVIWNIV